MPLPGQQQCQTGHADAADAEKMDVLRFSHSEWVQAYHIAAWGATVLGGVTFKNRELLDFPEIYAKNICELNGWHSLSGRQRASAMAPASAGARPCALN
jgi:hypothetical protein